MWELDYKESWVLKKRLRVGTMWPWSKSWEQGLQPMCVRSCPAAFPEGTPKNYLGPPRGPQEMPNYWSIGASVHEPSDKISWLGGTPAFSWKQKYKEQVLELDPNPNSTKCHVRVPCVVPRVGPQATDWTSLCLIWCVCKTKKTIDPF